MLCRRLRVSDGLDYSALAHLTPGYVGADLSALVREAALSAVNRSLLHQSCDGHVTVDGLCALLKEQYSPLSEEQLEALFITEDDFKVLE